MEPNKSSVEPPCLYDDEAQEFLKEHMDEDQYAVVMTTKQGKELPQVAARIFLNDEEWQQYLWISTHGSLEGFVKG